VVDPGTAVGKEVYLDVLEAAQERGIRWGVRGSGDSLNFDGIALRFLAPDSAGRAQAVSDANAASLIVELRYGAFTALLTGDAPVEAEERALEGLLSRRIQVLKVGHHGSATSTSPALLERGRPEAAIISVGRRNRYGHPHPGILERLEAGMVQVFRTDEDGAVVLKARRDGSYRIRSLAGG
jgi:competence protein ComEC